MWRRRLGTAGTLFVALWLAALAGGFALVPAWAAKSKAKDAPAPIGYGGPRLRMQPMMVPYHSPTGIRYMPLTIQMNVAGGSGDPSLSEKGDPREKQACFIIPILHERFLMYLFNANLEGDDFEGEKRDVLAKNLFDVAIATVGKGYYAGLELVPDDAPPLDPKSETLSKQCH